MFVKTKYKIHQALPINLKGDYDENDKCILVTRYNHQWYLLKREIIKQSENIEELFDEVVIKHLSSEKPYYLDINQKHNLFKDRQEVFKRYGVEEVYGAIWTDKGLLYVARMNDKGEWELL